jgi:hypothetical protein
MDCHVRLNKFVGFGSFNSIKPHAAIQMINALAIARDNEQAFMEAKYNEVVRTDDIEYQALANEIIADTIAHKVHIDRMFTELKKQYGESLRGKRRV